MYGTRIRELRKRRGWTMKELGQRLELAESTISGYENEIRRPDLDQLIRFAELFEVSVDYLIGRTDTPGNAAIRAVELRESPAPYNAAIWNGQIDALTDEEAAHLKQTLEMFRIWKMNRSNDG